MKKILFSAVLLTAALITFNSCEKEVKKQNSAAVTASNTSSEKVICPLSNIYETSYSGLGVTLCGPYVSGSMWGTGEGSTGTLDTKLNCNKAPGPGCNIVNAYVVGSFSYSTSVGNVLSDGVMDVAEQQALVNSIQSECTSDMITNFGAGYSISEYDCHFMQPLCGGCDGIIIHVNYTASKQCKTK
jgi:hypothetical protein